MKKQSNKPPLSAWWTGEGTKKEFYLEMEKLGLNFILYVMSTKSLSIWACAKENMFVVISTFSQAHCFVRIQPLEIAKQFDFDDFVMNN